MAPWSRGYFISTLLTLSKVSEHSHLEGVVTTIQIMHLRKPTDD